jgi:hypothetical protein
MDEETSVPEDGRPMNNISSALDSQIAQLFGKKPEDSKPVATSALAQVAPSEPRSGPTGRRILSLKR